MSITLGSNIASLRAQRKLSETSSELSTVFERLSSGQRINRASDDAAGLAIADALRADSKIFRQGVRNLNDGLSLLNIADSAVEILSSIVIRLEELATQAANGVYGVEQRKAIDGEAQALSDEFFRISKTTEFNGLNLFTGENPIISLQAGAGENAIINTSVGGAIGTGEFGDANTYAIPGVPPSIISGDFNGDGLLDLALTAYSSNDLSILLGQGDGSFNLSSSVTLAAAHYSIRTADFDNDGSLDLAVADQSNSVSIVLGIGNGTFDLHDSFAVGAAPVGIAIADFDGNGTNDIATGNFGGTVSLLLGQGDGSFVSSGNFTVDPGVFQIRSADFNGDSIQDVVTTSALNGTVSLILGNGDGTFQAHSTLVVGIPATDVESLEVADFNGDGATDIAVGNIDLQSLNIFLGGNDGSFQTLTPLVYGGESRSLSAGDFNGDGNTDLLSAEQNNQINVFLGAGDGTFSLDSAKTLPAFSSPRELTIGDFDGDGVQDVVSANYNSGAISVLIGTSTDGIHPLLPFSLKTLADARQALPILKRKREQLAAQRGEIGAYQARIDVAVNVLEVASENFRAAESRIRDADIAEEASKLTRLNILQQASAAILAQANQQPALALQLLG